MVERKSSKKKVVEKSVEASLWESANKLRGSVEPAEYNVLATLEQTAGAFYRRTFVDNIDPNNLPGGWRMGTVGKFCAKMTSGGTPSRTNNGYWNSNDYPWLKIGDVQNNFIFETEECISEAGLKNSSAKLIPAGSVVMAMYGATAAQSVIYNA